MGKFYSIFCFLSIFICIEGSKVRYEIYSYFNIDVEIWSFINELLDFVCEELLVWNKYKFKIV